MAGWLKPANNSLGLMQDNWKPLGTECTKIVVCVFLDRKVFQEYTN